MPKDILESEHIRLYKAPMAVAMSVVRVLLVLILFWALKHWVFTLIYDLSGWPFAKDWAGMEFLFWPAVILAGLAIGAEILRWRTTYYDIFPDRLVIRTGILSRARRSIDMDQFVALNISQSILGRVLGYGNIIFMQVVGTVVGKVGVVLEGVRKPDRLVDSASSYLRKANEGMRGVETNKAQIVARKVGVEPKPAVAVEMRPETKPEEVKPEPAAKTEPVKPAGQPIEGEISFS